MTGGALAGHRFEDEMIGGSWSARYSTWAPEVSQRRKILV